MPKRTDKGGYSHLVDLSYLPENYIKRIDDIFDSFFGLGMKYRSDKMETSAPVFPNKVSTLSSIELGNVLSEYTAWASYGADKAKYVTVAYDFIETELQRIIDRGLGDMVADKGNIEAKKAKARASEEYQTMLHYLQKLRGLKTMLDMEVANYDKCVASLSREVARRSANAGF